MTLKINIGKPGKLSSLGHADASISHEPVEPYFRKNYIKETLETKDFKEVIDRCRETFKKVSHIPVTSTIRDFTDFRRPSFSNFTIENETRPFYEASMVAATFVALLTTEYFENNKDKFNDIFGLIQEDWEDCKRCSELQDVLRAAYGVASGNGEFIEKYYTAKTLSFIGNIILLQSSICRTPSYQLVLEVFGKVFAIQAVVSCRDRIQQFIHNEKGNAGLGLFAESSSNSNSDFSNYIRFVTVIARMYTRTDFARHFYNVAFDLISPTDIDRDPYVAVYLSLLAALTVDEEMAKTIYDTLVKLSSYNIHHFLTAIQGYVNDFKESQSSIAKLSEIDSFTLEAKLDLIAQLFKHSEFCRNEINSISFADAETQSPAESLVSNMFSLIHSSVPATLKARCFDVLASLASHGAPMGVTWASFAAKEILTEDQIEANSGGIISDIEINEAPERIYPLMRAFIRFLSHLMSREDDAPSEELVNRIHTFLFENCLLKINKRLYRHFDEKWAILCELTQAWTNMFVHNEDVYSPLMRTSLCDSRFVASIISLLAEEECPIEALLCSIRLFVAISKHEDDFISYMDSSDQSTLVKLARQLSWSSDFLKKLITCVGEKDKDLQYCAIALSQYCAINAKDIVQVVFTRSNPTRVFIRVINNNEEENDISEGQEERTIRVCLLKFLVSLGEESQFVRFVCGFNVSDPPMSLLQSTLEKGILKKILEKMSFKNQNRNDFPRFIAISLDLILMLCSHVHTVSQVLNLLRSEHSFFNENLKSLQDKNSLKCAIGSFLQLVAREATDSSSSTSNTTISVYQILMGRDGFGDKRERVVLAFSFIDRIENDDDSVRIAKGLFEMCVAFLTNQSALILMKRMFSTWAQFILLLLNKCMTCTNPLTTKFMTQTCGFVAHFLFTQNKFGEVSNHIVAEVFAASIEALVRLHEMVHTESKMGIFTLISCMFAKGEPCEDVIRIYQEHNHELISVLLSDISVKQPAARAAIFACAEALISLANDDSLDIFIENAIGQLDADWEDYYEDNQKGAFIIMSKISFFTRYLSTKGKNPSIFAENGMITHIGYKPFWEEIGEAFSTSTTSPISETKLKAASGALRGISTLMIVAPNSMNVKEEVGQFLETFQETFKAIISFGGFFTLDSLAFLADMCCFIALIDGKLDEDLVSRLSELKLRFKESERWRELLRKKAGKTSTPSPKTFSIAKKHIAKLIMAIEQIEGNN